MHRSTFKTVLLATLTPLLALVFVGVAAASPYGSDQYGTCQYGSCSISLSTSGTVSLPLTPVGGSTICTTQADSVGVLTDASDGFTLKLADNDTNTTLVGSSHGGTFTASSGTPASPSVLTAGKWGYRVDGLGGMGSGPTSAGTNTAPLSLTFAGVQPSSGTPDTIVTTSVAANPTVTTNVWYGVCAASTQLADTYTDVVTYTAVTN